jgi:hypothetical protein
VYNKVGDSGDMVIQERGFSIVDIHEPSIAMPLSPFLLHPIDSCLHRNEIFLVGRHQEVRRFVSPGLLHARHANQLSSRDVAQWKTYVDFVCFVSSECGGDSLPSVDPQNGDLLGSISKGG